MFLAIKEMKDAKLKYSLLTGIIFLIGVVVFFLAGLAAGLADGFKQGIVDWDSTAIVLNEDANKVAEASRLNLKDETGITGDKVAPVGFASGSVTGKDSDEKENIAVFGTQEGSFIIPEILEGESFKEEGEVIVPQKVKTLLDLKVGDKLHLGNLEDDLKVVGFTKDSTYTMAPVLYTNLQTFSKIKYGFIPKDDQELMLNAFVVKDENFDNVKVDNINKNHLQKLETADFIENIPGYSAQNLTLDAMVYVLIVIAAAIIGIFMYVLTMQKKQLFGILKAQGVKSGIIANSVFAQSFLMAIIGTALAFALTFGLSLIMPDGLPFAVHMDRWLMYSALLIGVATLGGIFSVPSITKIDPIIAIGG